METKRDKKRVIYKQMCSPWTITCGKENPVSIGCEYYVLEDGEVATVFTPTKFHEGQLGIMHGGLSSTVQDELMGRAVLEHYSDNKGADEFVSRCVTAEMTVKYKKPILIGNKIYGYGRVYNKEGRRTYATSELISEEGEILSTAEAVFVEIKVPAKDLTDNITSDNNHQKLNENDPKEL